MAGAIMLGMTKDQALAYFNGSQSELARALDMSQSTISRWKKVPLQRQFELEALTKGRLQADKLFAGKNVRYAVEVRRKAA